MPSSFHRISKSGSCSKFKFILRHTESGPGHATLPRHAAMTARSAIAICLDRSRHPSVSFRFAIWTQKYLSFAYGWPSTSTYPIVVDFLFPSVSRMVFVTFDGRKAWFPIGRPDSTGMICRCVVSVCNGTPLSYASRGPWESPPSTTWVARLEWNSLEPFVVLSLSLTFPWTCGWCIWNPRSIGGGG